MERGRLRRTEQFIPDLIQKEFADTENRWREKYDEKEEVKTLAERWM